MWPTVLTKMTMVACRDAVIGIIRNAAAKEDDGEGGASGLRFNGKVGWHGVVVGHHYNI